MQVVISRGTRSVNIYSQTPARFDARLWVNCNPALSGTEAGLGDATSTASRFKTLKGAETWAARKLAD